MREIFDIIVLALFIYILFYLIRGFNKEILRRDRERRGLDREK